MLVVIMWWDALVEDSLDLLNRDNRQVFLGQQVWDSAGPWYQGNSQVALELQAWDNVDQCCQDNSQEVLELQVWDNGNQCCQDNSLVALEWLAQDSAGPCYQGSNWGVQMWMEVNMLVVMMQSVLVVVDSLGLVIQDSTLVFQVQQALDTVGRCYQGSSQVVLEWQAQDNVGRCCQSSSQVVLGQQVQDNVGQCCQGSSQVGPGLQVWDNVGRCCQCNSQVVLGLQAQDNVDRCYQGSSQDVGQQTEANMQVVMMQLAVAVVDSLDWMSQDSTLAFVVRELQVSGIWHLDFPGSSQVGWVLQVLGIQHPCCQGNNWGCSVWLVGNSVDLCFLGNSLVVLVQYLVQGNVDHWTQGSSWVQMVMMVQGTQDHWCLGSSQVCFEYSKQEVMSLSVVERNQGLEIRGNMQV